MRRFLKVMLGVGVTCVISGMVLSGVSLAFSGGERSVTRQRWRGMWNEITDKIGYHHLDKIDDYWDQEWEQWEKEWDQWEDDMDDLDGMDYAGYPQGIQQTSQTSQETALAVVPQETDPTAVPKGNHYDRKSKDRYQELTLGDSFADVQELEMELGRWQVSIREDDTVEYVQVVSYDRSASEKILPLKVKQDGNTVKIYDPSREGIRKEEWKNMKKDDLHGKLEIVIPKGMVLQGVDAELGRGELYGKNLKIAELDVESVGDISFEQCEVGQLDVSVIGTLDFTGAVTQEADIQCVSSEVSLLLDGKKEDFNYEIDGVRGSLTLDGQNWDKTVYEIREGHSARKTIEMECVTSQVDISFSAQ